MLDSSTEETMGGSARLVKALEVFAMSVEVWPRWLGSRVMVSCSLSWRA